MGVRCNTDAHQTATQRCNRSPRYNETIDTMKMNVNRLRRTTADGRATPGAQPIWLQTHATLEACDPDVCLLWPFKSVASGYGVLSIGEGRLRGAHSVSCENAYGPAPEGKTDAAHGCDTPLCVNPHHLRWATRQENMADVARRKGWKRKLTTSDVAAIRTNPDTLSVPALAAQFRVSEGTIYHIRRGHTWRTV